MSEKTLEERVKFLELELESALRLNEYILKGHSGEIEEIRTVLESVNLI